MSHQPASHNPSSESPPNTAPQAIQQLRNHDDVEKVVTYDDHTDLDGVMVILDWVTDETMEHGTRIINEKNYTGEIRRVLEFIDSLDGIRKTRSSKTGLARYTIHAEYTHTTQ